MMVRIGKNWFTLMPKKKQKQIELRSVGINELTK